MTDFISVTSILTWTTGFLSGPGHLRASRQARNSPGFLMFLLLLSLAPARAQLGSEPAPGRVNFLVIVTDDQRWDTLGAVGNHRIRTPNLDRLAREGVLFDNAFVTTSICATSRASILTGQYARRHGIWDFQATLSEDQLARTYPGVLKNAGYYLGFIGKWGVGQPPAGIFDFDRAFPGQGQYFLTVAGKGRHLTSVLADQAIEFLGSTNEERPFCLSISFKAPHVQDSYDISREPFPFDPKFASLYRDAIIPEAETADPRYFARLPRFLQDSEGRLRWAIRFWGPTRYQDSVKGYYRLISGVDEAVGRIIGELERRNLLQRTVVLFTSDNGFFLGEHGLAGKWLPYEESIRVPFLIRDPRRPEAGGSRESKIVLNIDLAPTLLELAGLATPVSMQGLSLLPILRGETADWREEFFYEHLFQHERIPVVEAVRSRRWKYVRYTATDPVHEELYDLEKDPLEQNDLLSAPAGEMGAMPGGLLAEMRKKWEAWRTSVR